MKSHIAKRSFVPIFMSLCPKWNSLLVLTCHLHFYQRITEEQYCFPNVPEGINHLDSGPNPELLDLNLNEIGLVVYIFTRHLEFLLS